LDETIATLKMAADLRVSANRARRLALQLSSVVDQKRLRSYATELEEKAAAMERRAKQPPAPSPKLAAEEHEQRSEDPP
jgi:hypothetical protein